MVIVIIMDTSNPVIPKDRRTIAELRENLRLRRRQDLQYLRDLALSTDRVVLPVESPLLPEAEVKDIFARFVEATPKISVLKEESLPDVFETAAESMPVCGLLKENGMPLRPPHINHSAGKVQVTRVMGGQPSAPLGLKHIIEVAGVDVLAREHIYTGGTWSGLMTRLEKQMGRSTKSVFLMFEKELGYKPSMDKMLKILNGIFPREKGDWPSLEGDLDEHLDRLKVTSASSAGAPYWRNKGEVMDDIIDVGLPTVVDAIKKPGGLVELFKKQPEMFLVEIKNKMDRYKISELGEKTRPYCCIPAHWAFLFSILTQKFQDTLTTFDKNESSVNAYGFSAAGGGLTRMYRWMQECKTSRYVVYGDDTCLIARDGNGVLYRVDPDFSQMDGSVDQDDVALVVEWVLQSNLKDDGLSDSPFWRTVCLEWIRLACDPWMILEGTSIINKKRPNGLMSGVPGTTLFDTVKSALAWHVYLEVCERDNKSPLDGVFAEQFMKRNGLVLKPGTWEPAQIPAQLSPGLLITDHKFLGVQMMSVEHQGKNIIVPTIPEQEALEMLVVQKDNPFERVGSELALQRRLYDRMRGLFITFGFSMPRIRDCLHNVVNRLPGLPIIMMTNLGSGERPEHIILQDYQYPDSSGFPTYEYCLALYSEDVEKPGWIHIFPQLEPTLALLRSEDRTLRRVALTTKMEGAGVEMIAPGSLPPVDPPLPETFKVLAAKKVQNAPDSKLVPNKRSEIVVAGTQKKRKTLPSLGEVISTKLTEEGPIKVGDLMADLLMTAAQFKVAAEKFGVSYTNLTPEGIAYIAPIQTPMATHQEAVVEAVEKQTGLINGGTPFRDALLKSRKENQVVVTAPTAIEVDSTAIDLFRAIEPPSMPTDIQSLVPKFMLWIGKIVEIDSARFKTTGNFSGEVNPVEVELQFRAGEEWLAVGRCRSANKQLGTQYIARVFYEKTGRQLKSDLFTAQIDPPEQVGAWKAGAVAEIPSEVLEQRHKTVPGAIIRNEEPAQRCATVTKPIDNNMENTVSDYVARVQKNLINRIAECEVISGTYWVNIRNVTKEIILSSINQGVPVGFSFAKGKQFLEYLMRRTAEQYREMSPPEKMVPEKTTSIVKRWKFVESRPKDAPKPPKKKKAKRGTKEVSWADEVESSPEVLEEQVPYKAPELKTPRQEKPKVVKEEKRERCNAVTPPLPKIEEESSSGIQVIVYAGQEGVVSLLPGNTYIFKAHVNDVSDGFVLQPQNGAKIIKTLSYMNRESKTKNQKNRERQRATPEKRAADNKKRRARLVRASSPRS